MFITLDDFFTNYRIKNEAAPNETTLNVGLIRLKREIRELKSILDVVTNSPIETWNKNKIYEMDEYISYNDIIYKSKVDANISRNPQISEDFWETVELPTIKLNPDTSFHYQQYTSIRDQKVFNLEYELVGNPCVFLDGSLVSMDEYEFSDKQVTFKKPLRANQEVVIIHGVAYETGIILPSEELIATANQFDFTVDFDLISPNVFKNGLLLSENDYTYGRNYISLEEPAKNGDIIVITNGASVGMKDYYTKTEINNKFNNYYIKNLVYTKTEVQNELDKLEDSIYQDSNIVKAGTVYTKTEVDKLLKPKATTEYVDEQLDFKADKATTLDGYGITNAYVKHEVDALLLDKLDVTEYTPEKLVDLLKMHTGVIPINVQFLNGYTSETFFNIREYQEISGGIGISAPNDGEGYIDITFDSDGKLPDLYVIRRDEEFNQISGRIYNALNSKDLILNIEGDFKGTFWVNLYNLGITEPNNYNWKVIVEPNTIPRVLKYDFVPKDYGYGYNFTGYYENTEVQASHFYGFVKDNILKCYAYAEITGNNMRAWQAHYKLIGTHKTISTNIYYNQGDEKINYIRYPFVSKPIYNEIVGGITKDMTNTPANPSILQDNALKYTNSIQAENGSTNKYQSDPKGIFTPKAVCNVRQINNNGEAIVYVLDGMPNSDIYPNITGDGEFTTLIYNFDDYGEAKFVVAGKPPFTTSITVSFTGSKIEPCSITIPITPTV